MQDSFFFFFNLSKKYELEVSPFYFAWKAQTCLFLWLLLQSLAENFRLTRLASIKVSKLAPYCRNRYWKEQVVIFFVFFYFSFILKNKRTNAVPTFFLLGAAEAAAGLLELVAVNFDHPKRAKDLCQVRGLVTGGQRSHSDKVWISARLDGIIFFFFFLNAAHQAKRTQQYMMAAPMMATALPSFWMPSWPTLG